MGIEVVCTGGNGTIGQFLPVSVRRLRTRLEESVELRVDELKKVARPPFALLHLAALTSVTEAEKDPARARLMNVDGSLKWLQAAADTGCTRFVFVSTGHVFRATAQQEFLTPDRLPDATATYGRTKAEAEVALSTMAQDLKIDLVIARVFSVTSEKMRAGFLFPELLRRARERDFSPLPGYKSVRDFVDAKFVAEQLFSIATTDKCPHSIVHISSGKPKSVRQLAEETMGAAGISRGEMSVMFPDNADLPNYLISEPTKIGER